MNNLKGLWQIKQKWNKISSRSQRENRNTRNVYTSIATITKEKHKMQIESRHNNRCKELNVVTKG